MSLLRPISLIVLLVVSVVVASAFGIQGVVSVAFAYLLGMAFSLNININRIYINSGDIKEVIEEMRGTSGRD